MDGDKTNKVCRIQYKNSMGADTKLCAVCTPKRSNVIMLRIYM